MRAEPQDPLHGAVPHHQTTEGGRCPPPRGSGSLLFLFAARAAEPWTCEQIIKKLIERKQSQIRKVYPGLTCFKEGVRQIPVESIPGIRERRRRSAAPSNVCDVVLTRRVFSLLRGNRLEAQQQGQRVEFPFQSEITARVL